MSSATLPQTASNGLAFAVLSPAVNRRRGTERAVAELVDRLARGYAHEIHLYAQQVDDLPVQQYSGIAAAASHGRVIWHRMPRIPVPHLLGFQFWMLENRIARTWDRLVHGLKFDVVFSPGINAVRADVILVHAVFHRLRELQNTRADWSVRGLHRRLYYRLLCSLESWVYRRKSVRLAAVSQHTAEQLKRYFGRTDVTVIPNGVDLSHFSAEKRQLLRTDARRELGYSDADLMLLLVGNDLRNKGLPVLMSAFAKCRDLPVHLCVVSADASMRGTEAEVPPEIRGRVKFLGETPNILSIYAAADVYVAPSLEDSFNLPVLEAMACGLPVVVSTSAGISEYLRDGEDAMLLKDPRNADELAALLRQLLGTPGLSARMARNAIQTASTLTWDRHAEAFARMVDGGASN